MNANQISATSVAFFFMSLPNWITYYSKYEEMTDLVEAARTPQFNLFVEVFDYVVIGAGSAGAVVANRLSRDPRNKVLVLENGGDPSAFTTFPSLFVLANQPSTDYAYPIVRQPNSCLENGGSNCLFSRGRGLGGSSNINAMNYVRGSPNEFDEWARLTGDSSWAYSNVLNVFKRSEDYHGHYELGDFHSRGGEWYVGRTADSYFPSWSDFFYDALKERNLQNNDMNANFHEGYSYFDVNIKNGRRWSTYNAFIKPILHRENLFIYRYSRVVKIHLNATRHAYKVQYMRHGKEKYAFARKEIVLCAGSIDSPKILMLSGIGPREHLQSVGIHPIVDLPVGLGLQDHTSIVVQTQMHPRQQSFGFAPARDLTSNDVYNYMQYGTGPLALPFFNPTGVVWLSSRDLNDVTWPDIEILCSGRTEAVGNTTTYQDRLDCYIVLHRPQSEGTLRLASRNPLDNPLIDPNYFSDATNSDIRRNIDAINFIIGLYDTRALQPFTPRVLPLENQPGCERERYGSRDYWECYLRQKTGTLCHPTRTCRMGRNFGDPLAVVDSKLRVLKTSGLRVVDSSVMPIIPSGHLGAPTIMIGEMGASFILEANRY